MRNALVFYQTDSRPLLAETSDWAPLDLGDTTKHYFPVRWRLISLIGNIFAVDKFPSISVDLSIVLFSGNRLKPGMKPSSWCLAVDYFTL